MVEAIKGASEHMFSWPIPRRLNTSHSAVLMAALREKILQMQSDFAAMYHIAYLISRFNSSFEMLSNGKLSALNSFKEGTAPCLSADFSVLAIFLSSTPSWNIPSKGFRGGGSETTGGKGLVMGSGGVGRGSKVVERRKALRVVVAVTGVVVVVAVDDDVGGAVVDVIVVLDHSGLILLGIFDGVLRNEGIV